MVCACREVGTEEMIEMIFYLGDLHLRWIRMGCKNIGSRGVGGEGRRNWISGGCTSNSVGLLGERRITCAEGLMV